VLEICEFYSAKGVAGSWVEKASAFINVIYQILIKKFGGWGGIRTHKTISGLPVFKIGM
jgi:hypothetical protein